MKSTKGEWKIREVKEGDEDEVHFINHTDEYQIRNESNIECIVTMGTDWASGKALANAQLISAAPDLYEALRALVINEQECGIPEGQSVIRAKKALAKAEGK